MNTQINYEEQLLQRYKVQCKNECLTKEIIEQNSKKTKLHFNKIRF